MTEQIKQHAGRLVVISAPSGAGKTTLVQALLAADPSLKFSISYTTRPRRPRERHGHDYFFVQPGAFRHMIKDGEFLEHAEVFGNYYGTGKRHVQGLIDDGVTVLLEIDWQGAQQVRAQAPHALSVFILPPSPTELERRLRGRGTDAEDVIRRRLGEALADMSHWEEFDHAIINDDLDESVNALASVIAGTAGSTYAVTNPDHRQLITRAIGTASAG